MSRELTAKLDLRGAAQLLLAEIDAERAAIQKRRDDLTTEVARLADELQALATRRAEVAAFLSKRN